MPRMAIFLRGVNVGGKNRVPMADFRALLEELGLTEVRTLLNSGNAVGTARGGNPDKLAKQIRAALMKKLDVDCPVIVKTSDELAAIEKENILAKSARDFSRLLVALTVDRESLQNMSEIKTFTRSPEKFVLGKHAAYLWCANGILESKAAEALLGKRGQGVTTRNWATFQKILGLVAP